MSSKTKIKLPKKIISKLDNYIKTNGLDDEEVTVKFLKELTTLHEPAKRTQLGRYTFIKKYLKQEHNKVFDTFKPDKELVDGIVSADDSARAKKSNIVVSQDIIDDLTRLYQSNNYIDMIISLMLASGRRINEVVNPEFKYTRLPKHPNTVKISHLSKQKESKKPARIELYQMTAKDFKNKYGKLQATIKGDSLSSLTKLVNKKLKQISKNLKSSHNLRGIYGLMKYRESGMTQNKTGFLTNILHHDSTETALSYNNYIFEE